MNLLAIELSSRRGSLAVLSGNRCLADVEVREEGSPGRDLFRQLLAVCRGAGVGLDALDILAPGRGPGAYAGMRLAVTLAQVLALPDRRRVYPVSSGEALAWEIAAERDTTHVVVLDDARRGKCWLGIFEKTSGVPVCRRPWTLAAPVEAARMLPSDALLVSPNWSLLRGNPEFQPLWRACWVEEDRPPQAQWVGALTWNRLERGVPPDPAIPLYLHPAVNRG